MSKDFIELANESVPGRMIRVRTDSQKLALSLTLRFQQGNPISAEEIRAVLSDLELKLSDDQQEKLELFLDEYDTEPRTLKETEVATGLPSVPGKDGQVNWALDIRDTYDTDEDSDEQVDHHRVTRFVNVGTGDQIFSLGHPEPGVDGIDIFGQRIPAKEGKPYPIESGNNVVYLEDGLTLVATGIGAIQLKHNILSVQPTHQIAGDVDFSVGHIDFDGTVYVKGNILGGFNVRTGEDLFVGGNIEGAQVNVGGNLQVDGGITGHGRAQIQVAGSAYAKYINGTSLEAGGDVLVKTEIVNSRVQSDESIMVVSGGIIGGEVMALYKIETGMLGSQMNVKTEVTVGIGAKWRKRVRALQEELNELDDRLQKVKTAVSRFLAQPSLIEKLPPEKQTAVEKLIAQFDEMNQLRLSLREEKKSLEQIDPCVMVHKWTYPNVFIGIGTDLRTRIGEETPGPIKYRSNRNTRRFEKVRP